MKKRIQELEEELNKLKHNEKTIKKKRKEDADKENRGRGEEKKRRMKKRNGRIKLKKRNGRMKRRNIMMKLKKKERNKIRHEATPESQEDIIEIRIKVPGAEFSYYNLNITQTILEKLA